MRLEDASADGDLIQGVVGGAYIGDFADAESITRPYSDAQSFDLRITVKNKEVKQEGVKRKE